MSASMVIDLGNYRERPRRAHPVRSRRTEEALQRLVNVWGEEGVCKIASLSESELEYVYSKLPVSSEWVHEQLCADLETWPKVFQRALQPLIDDSLEPFPGYSRRHWLWENFTKSRSEGIYGTVCVDTCGCGCGGMNTQLGRKLGMLRKAAAECRTATSHNRRKREQRLASRKFDVLETLWLHGVRRIDRQALAEHSQEAAEHEIEESRKSIKQSRNSNEYYGARLEGGGVYLKGPRKGQPLSVMTRMQFEKGIESSKRKISESHVRISHLQELLRNPAARVREYTGCAREDA